MLLMVLVLVLVLVIVFMMLGNVIRHTVAIICHNDEQYIEHIKAKHQQRLCQSGAAVSHYLGEDTKAHGEREGLFVPSCIW
jgi:hypothetical protein